MRTMTIDLSEQVRNHQMSELITIAPCKPLLALHSQDQLNSELIDETKSMLQIVIGNRLLVFKTMLPDEHEVEEVENYDEDEEDEMQYMP